MAQVGVILFNYLFTYLALIKQRPDFQNMGNPGKIAESNGVADDSSKQKGGIGAEVEELPVIPSSGDDEGASTSVNKSQTKRASKPLVISWSRYILGR